ncbi:UDP-2,3-diacetamido-2,3-dideoxy-D-glucuronate 2-epimerase [subsurface metagenome]
MKIITIVGARPQGHKVAPVSRAIEQHNFEGKDSQITEILVHTGQHYDHNMSQVFIEQLDIRQPKYHLEVGSGKHGEMTGKMLCRIEGVLMKERVDLVLVYGDTNSTLAGALAAAKLNIPVAHVEAGLRSFNRDMPEEINRILADHISSMLFCPTDASVLNLEREGITKGVFKVGDVMYDAFLYNKDLAVKKSTILSDFELKPGGYCLCTLHRQENTEDNKRLSEIFAAFEVLAGADCPFVVPLHPRTEKAIQRHKAEEESSPYVRLLPPVAYLDMIALEINARLILTDSGGVQKEAYFAQVPCVTLRDETEWIETLDAGWNYLGGADTDKIVEAFHLAVNSQHSTCAGLYGEGNASHHILRHLILAFS